MADNSENTLVIELKDGEVEIEMLPNVAPKHVERIKALARAGEYDNVSFHRV
ncbi:MAG TPA: peptidylprolyl isomerase, partial [Amaricoccus sp.]|nr:peptidylprolyl isomerase [Amaricoccus sp.]